MTLFISQDRAWGASGGSNDSSKRQPQQQKPHLPNQQGFGNNNPISNDGKRNVRTIITSMTTMTTTTNIAGVVVAVEEKENNRAVTVVKQNKNVQSCHNETDNDMNTNTTSLMKAESEWTSFTPFPKTQKRNDDSSDDDNNNNNNNDNNNINIQSVAGRLRIPDFVTQAAEVGMSTRAALVKKISNKNQNDDSEREQSKSVVDDEVHYSTTTSMMRNKKKKKIIPSEIHVVVSAAAGSGSTGTCTSLNSGFGSEYGFSYAKTFLTLQQQRIVNKEICLKLLESGWQEDNCLGIERLMGISNQELVNTQFDMESIASAFVRQHQRQGQRQRGRDSNKSNSKIIGEQQQQGNEINDKDDENEGDFSKRLRDVFLSIFCDKQHRKTTRNARNSVPDDDDDTSSNAASSSSSSSSSYTCFDDNDNDIDDRKDGKKKEKENADQKRRQTRQRSLKVPALRILISSLELISKNNRGQQQQQQLQQQQQQNLVATTTNRKNNKDGNEEEQQQTMPAVTEVESTPASSLNLVDDFWKCMLTYMTEYLQDLRVAEGGGVVAAPTNSSSNNNNNNNNNNKGSNSNSSNGNGNGSGCCLEATLVVKGFRLLQRIEPKMMILYIRYTLLPFILHAKEHGQVMGSKMLQRECARLLKDAKVQ